jgi:ABC-type Fe3+-hydroxamate transport system substrate-binding protein
MDIRSFRDQMGAIVSVPFPPRRIVSLVPSQTELLSDLGLADAVAGITKFCIHPAHWRTQKAIVGGTKNFNFDVIDSLSPDLIIGNKEENYEAGITALRGRYPVWMSDIVLFGDALAMIRSVAALTDRADTGNALAQRIEQAFASVRMFSGQRVLYLIWRNPWMAAGRGTFIDTMLGLLGLSNAVADARYPELSAESLRALNPEYVFLSSEPYPFREKHIAELRTVLPLARMLLVDGEMFSWYGSRLLHAPAYFKSLAL